MVIKKRPRPKSSEFCAKYSSALSPPPTVNKNTILPQSKSVRLYYRFACIHEQECDLMLSELADLEHEKQGAVELDNCCLVTEENGRCARLGARHTNPKPSHNNRIENYCNEGNTENEEASRDTACKVTRGDTISDCRLGRTDRSTTKEMIHIN